MIGFKAKKNGRIFCGESVKSKHLIESVFNSEQSEVQKSLGLVFKEVVRVADLLMVRANDLNIKQTLKLSLKTMLFTLK